MTFVLECEPDGMIFLMFILISSQSSYPDCVGHSFFTALFKIVDASIFFVLLAILCFDEVPDIFQALQHSL